MKKRTGERTGERTGKGHIQEGKEGKEDIYVRFLQFWKAYPRKVKKKETLKVWLKLNPNEELFDQIISGLEVQKQSEQWKKDGGQYIPHPPPWLRQERWNDEIQPKEEEDSWAHIPQ